MKRLEIVAHREGQTEAERWAEVERYLYGRPFIAWDTRTSAPLVTEGEVGLPVFTVAWPVGDDYLEMTKDRLASGMMGARVVGG